MIEEEADPRNELILAIFNKTGYNTNFKKVFEAIASGNEYFLLLFLYKKWNFYHRELLSTLIDSVFSVLNSQDEFSPDTKLHSIRVFFYLFVFY